MEKLAVAFCKQKAVHNNRGQISRHHKNRKSRCSTIEIDSKAPWKFIDEMLGKIAENRIFAPLFFGHKRQLHVSTKNQTLQITKAFQQLLVTNGKFVRIDVSFCLKKQTGLHAPSIDNPTRPILLVDKTRNACDCIRKEKAMINNTNMHF